MANTEKAKKDGQRNCCWKFNKGRGTKSGSQGNDGAKKAILGETEMVTVKYG